MDETVYTISYTVHCVHAHVQTWLCTCTPTCTCIYIILYVRVIAQLMHFACWELKSDSYGNEPGVVHV